MKMPLASLIVAALTVHQAQAQPAGPDNGVPDEIGVGADTCSAFLADIRIDGRRLTVYGVWAEGYISGYNVMLDAAGGKPTDVSGFGFEELKGFLQDFCKKHPHNQVATATSEFITRMRKAQGLNR
jgi:hypothetical protein